LLLLFSSFYLQPLYSYTIKDDSIRNNVNNKRDDDLWLPTVGTTWNWILNAPSKDIKSDGKVDVLDIDLFDHNKEKIESLKKDGHHIICYFSAGTYEYWRPDAKKFLEVEDLVRDDMTEWKGESYIDINNPELKPIMAARLDLAKEKGCDAVEPDNVDIYTAGPVKKWKVPITKEDQLNYDIWLATEAHSRGLSIGLKNDLSNLSKMIEYFDFAINEECYDYSECGEYEDTFIKQNKAVFLAAYGDCCDTKFLNKLLQNTKGKKLSIIIKDRNLGPPYVIFDPENYNYDHICNDNQNKNLQNGENENPQKSEISDDNKNLEKDNTKEDGNKEETSSAKTLSISLYIFSILYIALL